MKLTCVTATFNPLKGGHREQLVRCIESVAELKTQHEHLVFDGGSRDGTVELLRELERRIDGLRVLSETDSGVYDALNKGVRDARGEWFYVLGCDDYISSPGTMDRVLERVTDGVDIVVAPTVRDTPSRLYKRIEDLNCLFVRFPYSHQSVVMRTCTVREVGGFDTHYRICADWAMLMKCYALRKKFWYTESPIAYYETGGMSETDPRAGREQCEVYANFWQLGRFSSLVFKNTGYVPIRKLIACRYHPDSVVRASVRNMGKPQVVALMRILLWPIVWGRRILRCRKVRGQGS